MSDLKTQLHEVIQKELEFKEKREFLKAQDLYTKWISQALEDNPNNKISNIAENLAVAFNNRGQLKYLAVDFDGAVEDYDKALMYDQTLSCAYYNRGTIFYRMGYFDKALLDMTEATRLSPETQEFILGLQHCKKELTEK